MKKLFKSIFEWIRGLFSKSVEKDVKVELPEEESKLLKSLKSGKEIMDKMVDEGQMEQSKGLNHPDNVDELRESAHKHNQYKDLYNGIKGFNEPPQEIKNKLKTDKEKDERTLNKTAKVGKAILKNRQGKSISDENISKLLKGGKEALNKHTPTDSNDK